MNTSNQDLADTVLVTPSMLRYLLQKRLIPAKARQMALDGVEPAEYWATWIQRCLLFFGVSLVLAGIIYFFAYNWFVLKPWHKFSLIQGALLLSVLGALGFGLDKLSGKLAALIASVFVGVLLAEFGQIYQTGADAYQFFMTWAILILPWVLLSSFAPLWMVWIIVSNLFIFLLWEQTTQVWNGQPWIFLVLAGFNGVFLGLREALLPSQAWLKAPWTRMSLALLLLTFLTLFSIIECLDTFTTIVWPYVGVGILLYGLVFWAYRYRFKDIKVISLLFLSLCAVLEALMIRLVVESKLTEVPSFFWMLVFTVGLFSGAAVLLMSLHRTMERDL